MDDLLNSTIPWNPLKIVIFQKAEQLVKEKEEGSKEEARKSMKKLKNYKAPGSDNILLKLKKYGGEDIMYDFIYRIRLRVWQEEKFYKTKTK